ncbi:alpha/beta fold hydrolase [Paenibacillus radicis (ex Gao et al. 2016)]|uniref:Alpha/beta hydrolase n=1 Tax=Paenibacillus radicis (ex Gao et al. 2016) TaxID=1737354 RepID=A0A917M7E0_9BACL|nr:alpha/beta hydrolase [Paenibacillus radicis (ex Gao et al. 2016)]GGG82433.1 alpha/beta hydrolase [Paenibacillus radicis (ex Gao et al. 2016)]
MSKKSIAQHQVRLGNGIELAYYDSGEQEPGKPALVLLHGFCGSSAYWERVVARLAQHARIIAPDLRGQGNSPAAGEEAYTMELYADDLAGMLEHLNIPRVTLLGHSLGGYVTLAFADRYPDKLQAFGLVHSTPFPDSEAAKGNRDKAVAAIRKDGIVPFVDGLVPKLFAPESLESRAEQVGRAKEIGYGTSEAGAIGAALGMKERPDRNVILAETNLPLLLLAGELDAIIPVEKTLVVDGNNVTQVILKGAGHMGMLEQPDAFVQAVTGFLNK